VSQPNNQEQILTLLADHLGIFVSWEILQTLLGMTADEVAAQVDILRTQGLSIDGTASTGYRLTHIPDRLFPALIKKALHTAIVARDIRYFSQTLSTNAVAKELAAAGVVDGTLVIADEQTAGRGRLDRNWIAPAFSSILCSVIFYPPLDQAGAFRLTMLASIAVVRAIRSTCGIEALIKWPNDVYIGQKKVCGILTELSAELEQRLFCVVGIGINVNWDIRAVTELRDSATSLSRESGAVVSRHVLVKNLLEEMDQLYRELMETGGDRFREEWEQHALILNRQVRIVAGTEVIEGTATGIDAAGHLILIDSQGTRREIVSGDVSLKL
jgi:BirA family biotin operon repressor/biotin-[acetyl-CoA-carboxylase] ligase